MLDQKKIGEFVSSIRKEKGYTQKQLADSIGVSDKAISRWETGRGLPDTSIMPELCRILEININELLSGEHLSAEDYDGKAEKNMVELMKNNENYRKNEKLSSIGMIIGIIILITFVMAIILFGRGQIGWFLDIPSLLAVIGIKYIILGISKQFGYYLNGIKLAFGKQLQADSEELEKSEYAITYGIKATLYSGALSSIIGIVLSIGTIGNLEKLGPKLAVAILTVFYAIAISMVLHMFKGRLHHIHKDIA
ncbi:Helix-turn-helix domain-containing protein [Pseudobutyrivibrio sp. YE44]|uniref:helix-turn-helix domain-containing protein n=1 Tax=Pseudobutyrivibrio sp. YE44 TaxID=1520802 RepID=UPI00088B2CEC|nr:helix-turn-helix domain-containing protein [Pseudobutyrivibrio sp. YE44]SDB33597.1 Helix-turn-helix domain-containing protein [Pseudobutyrivibrio sp. YE44]